MTSLTYELVAPPGLNSDDTTFAATGRWADGDNVRFKGGAPEPIGRYSTISTASPVIPRNMFLIKRAVGGTVLFVGTNSVLQMSSSPYSSYATKLTLTTTDGWAFDAWGDTLLAVPRDGTLYEQSGSGTATAVSAAPDNITDMLVTDQRQLLAFGCNEEGSGAFNSRCIRGSDLEDYTDWTTTSANNAFEHILSGQGGIVAGCKVGSYIAVWTTTGLHLGQFIGDPSQTYRFDLVSEGCGLLGSNAVTIIDGVAYWLGTDLRVRSWAPGGPPQTVACPIGEDFEDAIQASLALTPLSKNYVFAFANTIFGEVWFFYNGSGSTEPGAYIAFSISESAAAQRPVWFRGTLQRNAMIDGILAGYPVLALDTADLYAHDVAAGVGATRASWFIQSAAQYLEIGRRRMMIARCVPDFEDQEGDVSLTLYMRDRPQSTAVTKGPYTLSASATKKDFRASGMLVEVRLSNDLGYGARLGKLTFDLATGGGR